MLLLMWHMPDRVHDNPVWIDKATILLPSHLILFLAKSSSSSEQIDNH